MRDALPNASFIGFTGTPIEKTDANTRAVFGDYISIYDIQRAVADKATVPIYYESRIAKLGLNAASCPRSMRSSKRSPKARKRRAKKNSRPSGRRWRRWSAIRKRIELIAADLVKHFEQTAGGDGRQGDDRLHEPPHLRGSVQGDHQAAPGMGERTNDDDDEQRRAW